MEERGHPFSSEPRPPSTSPDDPVLLDLMVRAGFEEVFVGIETPERESLKECKKTPRTSICSSSVRTLQRAGLEVQGGFIVGFDNDPPSIFDTLIQFIQESGIVVAMVGLLNAPVNTRLYTGSAGRAGCWTCGREQHRLLHQLRPGHGLSGTARRLREGHAGPLRS